MAGVLGTSIKRREDPALITGRGKYTDDLNAPGMAHAAIVRSPYAHARIRGIDASAAEALPGVLAVLTARDVAASGIPGVVPVGWLLPDLKTPAHPMIAAAHDAGAKTAPGKSSRLHGPAGATQKLIS